jgi:hypothetical protein
MYPRLFCSDTKDVKQQLRYLILILAVMLTTLCAGMAFAVDTGAQFGLIGGVSVPDAPNTNQYLLYGIKGSTFATESITIGGYYLMSNKGTQAAPDGFKYSIVGVQACYQIPAGAGETYLGVRAGITKVNITPLGTTTELVMSPYHYGIFTGHDYNIREWLLLGFEGSYLHAETGRATSNGTTYVQDSFNIINFLVSIQVRI